MQNMLVHCFHIQSHWVEICEWHESYNHSCTCKCH